MIKIYDIETLSNCFTYTDIDKEGNNVKQFVIHQDRNDLVSFIEHIMTLKRMIGFNNLAFDGQVIQMIIINHKKWLSLSGSEIADKIYLYAQVIIDKMNKGGWPDYPEWKMSIKQLDLFKIWHFDNEAKMTSLKWVEYMIDMDSIEEMPIHHNEAVTLDQINNLILPYNLHDVKATLTLYNITKGDTELKLYKGINKIQLRQDVSREFNIKCDNYNDVKIGDELNKSRYCLLKNIDKKKIPKSNKLIPSFKFKDCYPSYYKFETTEFINFVNVLGEQEVKLKKENKKSKGQSFEFTCNGTVYTIAKGGIHSNDSGRLVKPTDNEILRDADIGGMYPRTIDKRDLFPEHLGIEWLQGFRGTIKDRAIAKKKFKETKETKYQSIQETYKLSNNGGGFGKTNEESNWQYDPRVTFKTTIGGQIDLLMLIEDLECGGIHVISANTDGIVCLFDKSKEVDYKRICIDWEKQVGNYEAGNLEYVDYKLLAQTSVNSYIAIKTNGEIKTKNEFSSDFELHKNKSSRVIPLALQEYFVRGTKVKDFITKHDNILDFCNGVKSIGKNRLIAIDKTNDTETKLQKINRYYISNQGVNIVKNLHKHEKKKATNQLDIFGNVTDDSREQEVEAGWKSTIFNKIIKKDIKEYDINYDYYIEKTNKILNQIIK